MKKFLNKRTYKIIILLVLDGLFFDLTNPNKVNSIFLIVGFILLGATFYYCLDGLIRVLQLTGLRIKHNRKLAVFGAILISALFVLQSLGQLSVKDFYVILLIAVVAYIYTSTLKS